MLACACINAFDWISKGDCDCGDSRRSVWVAHDAEYWTSVSQSSSKRWRGAHSWIYCNALIFIYARACAGRAGGCGRGKCGWNLDSFKEQLLQITRSEICNLDDFPFYCAQQILLVDD
jgi:hypothetical protein